MSTCITCHTRLTLLVSARCCKGVVGEKGRGARTRQKEEICEHMLNISLHVLNTTREEEEEEKEGGFLLLLLLYSTDLVSAAAKRAPWYLSVSC